MFNNQLMSAYRARVYHLKLRQQLHISLVIGLLFPGLCFEISALIATVPVEFSTI